MNRLRSRSRELLLLLFAAALLALMLFGLETSQGRTLSTEMLYIIGGFVGVYAIAHVAIAVLAPYADQVMLPVVALLNAIGLVVIYRLDLAERPGYGPLAERQMRASSYPGGCGHTSGRANRIRPTRPSR